MSDQFFTLIEDYIGVNDSKRAAHRAINFDTRFSCVVKNGCLPENGFSETEVESILQKFALMDSNNWAHSSGVGEREGRILLDMVKRRHFGLAHGVGRSGDIAATQPKAPGSSVLNKLTTALVLDWLRRSGAPSTKACVLVPMATGMSLTLSLLNLKQRRGPKAKYVIWSRIDQKSCLKCITTAGLIPVPIEPIHSATRINSTTKNKFSTKLGDTPADSDKDIHNDQLITNLSEIEQAMQNPFQLLNSCPHLITPEFLTALSEEESHGTESIVCVLSTTTCFSPRVPDKLCAISRLCAKYNIPHLVNNAYGVQSKRCMRMLESSWNALNENSQNPVDFLYVQSTDKNLMVPVGGAIIAGFSSELVEHVAKSYPGRGSSSPTIDVFATLMHLGWKGWQKLVEQREVCYLHLSTGLQSIALKYGLRLLETADNPISLALSLEGLIKSNYASSLTQLGAKLFTQGCTGVRVVIPASMGETQCISGLSLPGFNSHSSKSKEVYMNAAAAIGQTEVEINLFLSRLDKAVASLKRQTIT